MLISFAKQTGNERPADGGDRFLSLTHYMDAAVVLKPTGPVRRDPMPEVLLGRADVFRRHLGILPTEHRYTSAVLSFAPEDVDVDAFNAGDPALRRQIDLALELVFEAAWAGVPDELRPPRYVTTHTHAERLEVNIALPRAVLHPDGGFRGFNAAPPKVNWSSSHLWVAVQDVLNHRFGWADPGDPARARSLVQPDWILKHAAEERRAGVPPEVDDRARIACAVQEAFERAEISDHDDVVRFLSDYLAPEGRVVLSRTTDAITVGPPDAPREQRWRLRGPLFAKSFTGRTVLEADRDLPARQAVRRAVLEDAPACLAAALEKTARYNRAELGHGRWPAWNWRFDEWQRASEAFPPRRIPRRHHGVIRQMV